MNKSEIEIVECVSCGETEGNLELVYGDNVFCETCIQQAPETRRVDLTKSAKVAAATTTSSITYELRPLSLEL